MRSGTAAREVLWVVSNSSRQIICYNPVTDTESVITRGDLNGRVGKDNQGIERVNGGWGFENDAGEKIWNLRKRMI